MIRRIHAAKPPEAEIERTTIFNFYRLKIGEHDIIIYPHQDVEIFGIPPEFFAGTSPHQDTINRLIDWVKDAVDCAVHLCYDLAQTPKYLPPGFAPAPGKVWPVFRPTDPPPLWLVKWHDGEAVQTAHILAPDLSAVQARMAAEDKKTVTIERV